MDLSLIPSKVWIAVGLVVLAVGWQYKDTIVTLVQGWLMPTTKTDTTGSEDADVQDMISAKRLAVRFKNNGCKEGQDAMQVVMTHFFHTNEGA